MTAARVIKVGGAALAQPTWLEGLAGAIAASTTPIVVVHGGGPEITSLSARLGLDATWWGGRRVTSDEALDVASMALNGRVNKRIVSALVSAGVDAVGISGEDGGLLVAALAEDGLLGRVGVVETVRTDLLEWLLGRDLVPVVSPISRGPGGAALNVNADEAASAVAVALGAPELVFLTDVAGVQANGAVVPELSGPAAADLIATGAATGGMAIKLTAALDALDRGVTAVRIGAFEVLGHEDSGTRIRATTEVLACS